MSDNLLRGNQSAQHIVKQSWEATLGSNGSNIFIGRQHGESTLGSIAGDMLLGGGRLRKCAGAQR